MSVTQMSAIEDVLAQMRAIADAASGYERKSAQPVAEPGGFAAELQRSLHKVSSMQQLATTQAKAFQSGAPDISLNDVMIDMQKASVAFQASVQVRNRLVAAYQEISSMPV